MLHVLQYDIKMREGFKKTSKVWNKRKACISARCGICLNLYQQTKHLTKWPKEECKVIVQLQSWKLVSWSQKLRFWWILEHHKLVQAKVVWASSGDVFLIYANRLNLWQSLRGDAKGRKLFFKVGLVEPVVEFRQKQKLLEAVVVGILPNSVSVETELALFSINPTTQLELTETLVSRLKLRLGWFQSRSQALRPSL